MMASESERLPLGLSLPAVPTGVGIPAEPPEIGARALSVASRLLAGASTFFFLAFLFAYFYLRSINQSGWWKPTATLVKEQKERHVNLTPNAGLGVAFIACIVLSAGLMIVAGRQMKGGLRSWTTPAVGGVVLGLAAVALQCF